jgi:hypothetical protein
VKIALFAVILAILSACGGDGRHCNPPTSDDCNFRVGGVFKD